jgi:2-polyprenyl-3-methyl-5-hydroxy-6-metoxy-1,4-benzoquinol methylase
VLPIKLSLRLFSAPKDFVYIDFYDRYVEECKNPTPIRLSEVEQLKDLMYLADVDYKNKEILDISGGPGLVAKSLAEEGAKVTVTELTAASVEAMSEAFPISACVFAYDEDDLTELFEHKQFDIVLIRSSIIFARDINKLISEIEKVVKPGGKLLIETTIPTLGEVFWWQTMEYKFPFVYSKSKIYATLEDNGFSHIYTYEEAENYASIKLRSKYPILKMVFTLLIDFPMTYIYYFVAAKRHLSIDTSLNHRNLITVWQSKNELVEEVADYKYWNANYVEEALGEKVCTTHFNRIYNGFFRRFKDLIKQQQT